MANDSLDPQPEMKPASLHNFRHAARLFNVEDVQELVVQFVDTEDYTPHRACQSFRWRLEAGFFGFDHVADFIHQQADWAVDGTHHHVHGKRIRCGCVQFQSPPKIDHGHNLAAQVDQAADYRGRD